ncbi:hypothetical protein SDRG_14752 [Saprolegnia diclina VS20]|uniref:Uncharacterized protein n=1 Tax=Saprolegnia diclina (strain VS20) TaxID=1156394 RepID=T0PYW7_SAPDV|nr:hypothetical protein SDRG_14752 [Saprolegnia diclina VS20]EQC27426.1 hypothetical protein SDRG_14752 [Saprolegnia diclina VS20]|eukprot:XP_008619126.1 hypothetical protein SDRG_14752 [Saprolegnia diclina VS20]
MPSGRVAAAPPIEPFGPSSTQPAAALLSIPSVRRSLEVLGMLYVVGSMALSVYVLGVFATYLSTDYVWPDLSASGPIVVALFNNELALRGNGPLDLLSTSYVSGLRGTSPAYPRLIMYSTLTSLTDGVKGLRRLRTRQVVKMVTPYCWADLAKRWEMAYTLKRQARCAMYDGTNGAVHLETVLRNINFAAWLENTQGKFASAIGNPIAASSADGAHWLAALKTHTWSSVDAEVALWSQANLTHFTLQYGTGFGIGITETILVENALGQQLPMTIKAILATNRWTFRTTGILYNLLYDDLYAIGTNQSLVRGTANYFANIDKDQIERYIQGLPLGPVEQALHDSIGPLGIIDVKWVPPPQSLLLAVDSFEKTVYATHANSLPILSSSRRTMLPTPPHFADPTLRFYSGNPMCTFGVPLPFVQQTFGFDDVCGSQTPLTVEWHLIPALFSLWLHDGVASTSDVCAVLPPSEWGVCATLLADVKQAYTALAWPAPPVSVRDDVAALRVGLLQILERNGTIQVDEALLLAPNFSVLGWMYLLDWALNAREVISVQGDVGTFTIVSYLYTPIVDAALPPLAGLGPYLSTLAALPTVTLLALVVVLLIVRLGQHTRGTSADWVAFYPVGASIWVSRNVLVVRSVAAILCLSTVPLQATTQDGLARVALSPRPLWLSGILAGESIWLIYAAQYVCLPLYRDATALPFAAGIAWAIVLALDHTAPLTPSALLSRSCYAVNMDYMTYCASGLVRIGSGVRCFTIVCIHASSVLATLLLAARQNQAPRRPYSATNGLVPLPALLFLHEIDDASHHELRPVAAILCGIFPFTFRGNAYVFDVKLWLLLHHDDFGCITASGGIATVLPFHAPSPAMKMQKSDLLMPKVLPFWTRLVAKQVVQQVLRLLGLVYLGGTLWSNVAYLDVLQRAMANDFGWAGFNTTGAHLFLANTLNRQLLSTSSAALTLEDAALGDPFQGYDGSANTVSWYPTVARRYLFNTSAPLLELIQGLRSMDPCQLPWMFTQYCYLDLDRVWEMASTSRRQERCQAWTSNGAVFLESSLRNLRDWSAWDACWGDSFAIGFGQYLTTSSAGRAWLQTVRANALSSSDEAAYWQRHGISYFLLQWQNFKDTGLMDDMVIMNAFGVAYHLPLSQRRGVLHLDHQTSHRMYWSLASDLWALSANHTLITGTSLLRSAPNYAFTNTSSASLLFQNLTLHAPLRSGLALLEATLGPFGAVDMIYVSVPSSLLALFDRVNRAIANVALTTPAAQTMLQSLPIKQYIGHVPKALLQSVDVSIVGGNLFCGNDIPASPPSGALYALFGMDYLCSWWYHEYMTPSTSGLLLALLGFDGANGLTSSDLDAFCANDVYVEDNCVAIYAASYMFIKQYLQSKELTTLATVAEAEARALQIHTVQYLSHPNDSVSLYKINILDATERSWIFFGWCYLAEWVVGQREVVAFHGDSSILTAISSHTNPLSLALTPDDIPTRLSYVCQQCVRYIAGVFIGVAGVLALYASVVCRGCFEGMNLFALNRIVGDVYIGRTLLIVRGITAVWLLNTQPLVLAAVGVGARLTAPRISLFTTLLASSELTWLVYIVNDLFSCVTRQHTTHYSWKSSISVWALATLWTLLSPQGYSASLARSCAYVDMDLELHCVSGYIRIGDAGRLFGDVGLVLACVLSCALVERWMQPSLVRPPIPTLLLSASSFYMLELDLWTIDGKTYLDRMSAAMAGMLTLQWREDYVYVFDVKSWRLFSYEPERHRLGDRFRQAIPLHRLG